MIRDSKKLIKLIQNDGWYRVRVKGSHYHFNHPTKPGTVTIPHPKRDLAKRTVDSILKQAQLKE